MITTRMQVFTISAVVVFFLVIINLIRKRQLLLKYSLLWMFSGLVMLVLAVFPGLLDGFAGLIGIYSSVNALFAALLFCGLILLISFTVIISKENTKIVQMVQKIALLEKRIRELEGINKTPDNSEEPGNEGK